AEVSHFTQFMGTINQNGKLTLNIDLNSLETNIPIRNERIQKHLFQTDIYKTADIHAQIKPEHLQPGIHKIAFDVDLHGLSALLNAEFMVLEQFGNKIVTLHKPLIINASTFGLENGVDVLRKLAHLDSINYTVPVNFILTFEVVK
ncbi:MAG: YceI family protein, partial [Marinicellaceae bacterium]